MTRRSYGQFCPIARSLEIVGERWTLLVIRELMLGPQRFTDLRTNLPGVASNLLADRLKVLAEHGIVTQEATDDGFRGARARYQLTERGRRLDPLMMAMARWGFPILGLPSDDEPLELRLIPDGIRAMCRPEALPAEPMTVVLEMDVATFELTIGEATDPDGRPRSLGERMTVRRLDDDAPVPVAHVTVTGMLGALVWVITGQMPLTDAVRDGLVGLAGAADDVRTVAWMFDLDPDAFLAGVVAD